MKLVTRLLPVAAILTSAGCVSRAEMDAVKQQLETCDRDKVAAQKAQSDCDGRLTTESKRWDAIETQLTTSLPQTLAKFEDERTKIITIVPEQVRNEVGRRLDRYFVNVAKEFQRMDTKLDTLREELKAAHGELADLTRETRTVNSKLDQTHQAVIVEQTRSGDQHRKVAEIIATIAEFDRQRINCDKCKEKIKLKGKGKEQLLTFHSDLIQKVQGLSVEVASK
jgi:chromosome segregation ATPase